MSVLILVDSQLGNTARLAEAVADGFGPTASVIRVGQPGSRKAMLSELDLQGLDLLVVGGPTIDRGMSQALAATLDVLKGRVHGVAVAAFDSRLRGPGLFMGSAAKHASKRLRADGAHVISPPEGFYVRRGARAGDVDLIAGELDRARSWGGSLRDAVDAKQVA